MPTGRATTRGYDVAPPINIMPLVPGPLLNRPLIITMRMGRSFYTRSVLFEFLPDSGRHASAGTEAGTDFAENAKNYRKALDGFRPTDRPLRQRDVHCCSATSGSCRNRLKTQGHNLEREKGSSREKRIGTFDAYLWTFVGTAPSKIVGAFWAHAQRATAESDANRDLLQTGFKFVRLDDSATHSLQATVMVTRAPL